MGKRYVNNNPDPDKDTCYYCGGEFASSAIEAHESTCDKNPSMQQQDDD